MNIKKELSNMAKRAQEASRFMLTISSATKNKVLESMALALNRKKNYIIKANKKDIKIAMRQKLSSVFIDRLALSQKRIKEMSDSLSAIAMLNDPVGEVIKADPTDFGYTKCACLSA
jgi:glutamate-5-semialdehyde dehydrogenase